MTDAAGARLLVGGYTPPNGVGSGIGALTVDGSGRVRVAGVAAGADSPSFLAAHPSQAVVYAVAESEQTVRAYRGSGEGRLESVGEAWPAGEAACHVAVDPLGRFLVVACWGSGEVLLYELDELGGIVSRFDSAPAVDPYPGAERVSRAHAALILPGGRVLTSDLGFDLLRVWTWRPGVGLVADGEVPLGAGSGPRHLALHPAGFVYVVTEYSIEVLVLAPDDAGRFTLLGRTPARAGGREDGDSAAEISIDDAGRRVYVTVRGSNVVSTLAVQDGGSRLEPLGDVASGGDWPRHHLLRGAWLHVANERSSTVTTFRLDPVTGLPAELVDTAEVDSPTCLLELR